MRCLLLLHFLLKKKTLDSVDITSEEDNGDHDEQTSETETINETAPELHVVNNTEGQTIETTTVQNGKPVKTRRFKKRVPHSASAVLMAKLLDNQQTLVPQKEPDELDRFFLNISETVKKFSKYQQALVKNKVFSLVSEMELQLHSPATYNYSNSYTPSPAGTSSTPPSVTPVPTSPENWNIFQ